ncbi:putative nuclease HARBI1 [Ranitomeya imitator]|uniref:putative nuclease HARBI1 n=1 Tax=Ranitomeya imitator TaxID=111125 RepID=UPI0037E92B46
MESIYMNMELDFALANAYAIAYYEQRKREKRRRSHRRFWLHPIVEVRESREAYNCLFGELNDNLEKYFEFTRMSQDNFRYLLRLVEGAITRQDTQLRRSISAEEQLLVTLRFLATGETLRSLHFQFRIGVSTLSGIVADTCRALWDNLRDEFLPLPTTELWEANAPKFEQLCSFPNCIGAVDGKHIRITKPVRTGSQFFNYKKYFSTVLMQLQVQTAGFSPWTLEHLAVQMTRGHLKSLIWAKGYMGTILVSTSHDLFPTPKARQYHLLWLGMRHFKCVPT